MRAVVALRTGWTPDQIASMRPRDYATVVQLLAEEG